MSDIKSALEISQWLVDNLGILSGMLILGYILLFVLAFWQWNKIGKAKAAWEPEARKQKAREIELDALKAQLDKREDMLISKESALSAKAEELSKREEALNEANKPIPSVMVQSIPRW